MKHLNKRILTGVLISVLCFTVSGCDQTKKSSNQESHTVYFTADLPNNMYIDDADSSLEEPHYYIKEKNDTTTHTRPLIDISYEYAEYEMSQLDAHYTDKIDSGEATVLSARTFHSQADDSDKLEKVEFHGLQYTQDNTSQFWGIVGEYQITIFIDTDLDTEFVTDFLDSLVFH